MFLIFFLVIVISASLVYYAERIQYNPSNHFASIPVGLWCSGVVRQSAAWGENKKCRPCLYFLLLFEYDSGSFDWLFCLPKIWIWFKWNKKLWTALFHESLTVTILFTESFSNPSLWPSGIGSCLWRIGLWVRFLTVSDIYPMFLDPTTITWVPSGFSGYIWLDTTLCLKKLAHFGKLWIQYSTATLPIHPLHDTPDKQSLSNLFLQFFNDIIERIRSKFPSSDSPIPSFSNHSSIFI